MNREEEVVCEIENDVGIGEGAVRSHWRRRLRKGKLRKGDYFRQRFPLCLRLFGCPSLFLGPEGLVGRSPRKRSLRKPNLPGEEKEEI